MDYALYPSSVKEAAPTMISASPAVAGNAPLATAGRALARHRGAVAALTLLLIAGLAVLDDYGVGADEDLQARYASANLIYAAGGAGGDAVVFEHHPAKYYGVAFELPLLLVGRAVGESDSRAFYLSRHLLGHLFYLIGGLFAYLLARRLFNNRLLALLAMLLFLLHPRLYSHSFYNSKDTPFFVMFMMTLFLADRAFKRDTLRSFLLLGIGVGILMNLRAIGVVAFAAVPAMRALDLYFASEREERKRILLSTAVFLVAGAATLYASIPHLWVGPSEWVEWWRVAAGFPFTIYEVFRGEATSSSNLPPDYLATWFSITTPPFMLLLGLVGAAVILRRSAASPLAALANSRLRFGLLLIGCFALPLVAVIILDTTIYNAWRQMQFLWAPFALLAAFGLRRLASYFAQARLRAAVYGAAGAGLAAALVSMALIHPHQQIYFNFLVDRVTPDLLRTQYDMDYWGVPAREALERLLKSHAPARITVNAASGYGGRLVENNLFIIPKSDRERVSTDMAKEAYVFAYAYDHRLPPTSAAHTVKVYNNTIAALVSKPDIEAIYKAATSNEPLVRGLMDIYVHNGQAVFVKEPCVEADTRRWLFELRTIPRNPEDLPRRWTAHGRERLDFYFPGFGAPLDGKCAASVPLPEYHASLRIRQRSLSGYTIWEAKFTANPELHRAVRSRVADQEPAARSVFDVHLEDGSLVYVKEPCVDADAEPNFFLHVTPQQATDLPEQWREYGFEGRDFDFFTRGAVIDGACVASTALPEYPIAGIRTGQFISGYDEPRQADARIGDLWEAKITANPESLRAVRSRVADQEPAARSVFDVHLADGALIYVKEPCVDADAEPRFFLHVTPQRATDLPERWREYGFENLDFDFFTRGALLDGACVASTALPEYPIASVRTGQFISGRSPSWSVTIAGE